MDAGNKLKELNLTPDEIDRFTKAFSDEKFKDLLREYAQEISDPEARKTYEAEIKLLEEERGNSVEFLHPTPFKALKTSVGGEQKCYVNICADENIDKPEFTPAVSKDGRRGQCWTLPHRLHRGGQIRNAKGDKSETYDVIFHPDTLHMATKNKRFMDMVENAAIKGIQETFNVTLDENNVREMKTKYKGVPQPCVIRKPIPGITATKKPPEQADTLAFLFPDVTRLSESPPKINSSFQIQRQKSKEPTKPKYAVKYRSVVDLQDYRCSRDSAQSPRPKEIVVTIDLPLLRSAGDTSLEVMEKILLLESREPAYKLELPLAYPVDENNGNAKFNKQSRQLIITLPVRPPHETFDFCVRPASPVCETQSVHEDKEERAGVEEEGVKWEKLKGEDTRTVEKDGNQTTGREQFKNSEGVKEDGKTDKQEKTCELERKGLEAEEEEEMRGELPKNDSHEDTLQEKSGGNEEEDAKFPAEEESTAADNHAKTDHQHVLTSNEDMEAKLNHAMVSKKATDIIQNNMGGVSISEGDVKSSQMFATDETNSLSRKTLTVVPVELSENHTDGDGVPAQQCCQTPEHDEKPPAAFLREIHADGNETVIRDHSTSAGFVFQNKLMYELD
nr:protein kintoun [Nothobranchius furzeri]